MLIIGEIYQAEIKMHSRNILKSQDCFIRPDAVCMFCCIPGCKALTFTSDRGHVVVWLDRGPVPSQTNRFVCLNEKTSSKNGLRAKVNLMMISPDEKAQMWKNPEYSYYQCHYTLIIIIIIKLLWPAENGGSQVKYCEGWESPQEEEVGADGLVKPRRKPKVKLKSSHVQLLLKLRSKVIGVLDLCQTVCLLFGQVQTLWRLCWFK